jgi:hypothetical protein
MALRAARMAADARPAASHRPAHDLRNAAPAAASRDRPRRRLIRVGASDIRVIRVQKITAAKDAKAAASARIEAFLETLPGLPLSENGKITIDRDEMYHERFRRFDHDPVYAGPGRDEEARDLLGVVEEPSPGQGDGSKPAGP